MPPFSRHRPQHASRSRHRLSRVSKAALQPKVRYRVFRVAVDGVPLPLGPSNMGGRSPSLLGLALTTALLCAANSQADLEPETVGVRVGVSGESKEPPPSPLQGTAAAAAAPLPPATTAPLSPLLQP